MKNNIFTPQVVRIYRAFATVLCLTHEHLVSSFADLSLKMASRCEAETPLEGGRESLSNRLVEALLYYLIVFFLYICAG